MAVATTGTSASLTTPAGLAGGRSSAAPHCVGALPMLPPPPPQTNVASSNRTWKSTAYCRKIARDVVTMATTGEASSEVAIELPEIAKTIQDTWEKVEDKYAAVDRLPLIPGILELVGIGYTGWFAYRNLIFKPDREALIAKIKSIYSDILGSS